MGPAVGLTLILRSNRFRTSPAENLFPVPKFQTSLTSGIAELIFEYEHCRFDTIEPYCVLEKNNTFILTSFKRGGSFWVDHPKTYIMETEPLEMSVLNILADEWDEAGPPGILETTIMARRLGMPIDLLLELIDPLYANGLVDSSEDGYAFYLTPEGYESIRS